MSLLLTVFVTFFAGMGAGLGTGFAGLSAAAVISPMLITFLHMDPYMAVGIALSSDVLASAISAYTYHKNKNLDVKTGDHDGKCSDLYRRWKLRCQPGSFPDYGKLFRIHDLPSWYQIHCPPCHDNKRGYGKHFSEKEGCPVRDLRRDDRLYLWLYRCRRWYDDAPDPDQYPGL